MSKSWFQFTNTADKEAEVSIYDAIGYYGVSAKSFLEELKKHTGKKLTVRINSPGGVVTEGLAIFNGLKRHKGGVIVQIDALAASMATYVALAGAPIRMAENSYFMIHNVSGGAFGTADEMRKAADVCEKLQNGIVTAYVVKTGRTKEEVEEKMDEETWFTAEEAKDFGFVDEITDPIEAAACVSVEARALLAKFRHLPEALRVDSRPPANMKIISAPLAALLANLTGVAITEDSNEAAIKAALDGVTVKITALEGDKTRLTADLATAASKITALEGDKTKLTTDLATANGKVTTLEGDSKTADQKAKELAAAHGSAAAGGKKDDTVITGNGEKTGKDLFEAYNKLTGREAGEFWKANEKALMAYAEEEERRARRNH